MLDTAGVPLPGVNVAVEGLHRGSATDEFGRFAIDQIEHGSYILVVSAVGFERTVLTVTVPSESQQLRILLKEISIRSGEIVVSASRRAELSASVPASYRLLTPDDLQVRSVVTLDQALRYVPGVQVLENQVNIRGSSGYTYNVGSRVLLLLDGLPLLTPDSDGVPFDALPFNNIEQIEVVKGPGSALWGSGALGGVIHVLTKDFPETPQTMVRLQGGVHEPVSVEEWLEKWPDGSDPRPFWGVSASHARRLGDNVGFWINIDHRDDRGYANRKTERFSQLYGKLGWRPGSTTNIEILAAGLSRRKENFLFWNGLDDALNPGVPTVGGSEEDVAATDVQTDQLIIAPSLSQIVSRSLLLEVRTRAYGTRIEGIGDSGAPSGDVTHGFRYGGDIQATWTPSDKDNVVAGASYDANTTTSPFFVTDEGDLIGDQPEMALFGQYERTFGRLLAIAGLRYAAYQPTTVSTSTSLSPKLALSYAMNYGLTLRASVGHGFRVPSLAERFIDDQDYLPLYPNVELEPEESISAELGARWDSRLSASASFRLDGAFFWNEYDGLIEAKLGRFSEPGEPLVLGFQFANLRRARIYGLDASADVGLLRGTLDIYAGYTYMHSEDLDEGLPLPFRSEHLINVGLRGQFLDRFEAGGDFRVGSEPERLDSDFSLFVPDSEAWVTNQTIDVWISARFGAARLTFHSRNLADRYYTERPAFLGAPRHYLLELRFDF